MLVEWCVINQSKCECSELLTPWGGPSETHTEVQVTRGLLKYNNRVKRNHKSHIRLEGTLNEFPSCYLRCIVRYN